MVFCVLRATQRRRHCGEARGAGRASQGAIAVRRRGSAQVFGRSRRRRWPLLARTPDRRAWRARQLESGACRAAGACTTCAAGWRAPALPGPARTCLLHLVRSSRATEDQFLFPHTWTSRRSWASSCGGGAWGQDSVNQRPPALRARLPPLDQASHVLGPYARQRHGCWLRHWPPGLGEADEQALPCRHAG